MATKVSKYSNTHLFVSVDAHCKWNEMLRLLEKDVKVCYKYSQLNFLSQHKSIDSFSKHQIVQNPLIGISSCHL